MATKGVNQTAYLRNRNCTYYDMSKQLPVVSPSNSQIAANMSRVGKRTALNRNTMSCDRCRSRKTKCRKSAGLPCDYCRTINEECSFEAGKQRKKPFYFVSEEEYRLLYQLCQQTFPNQSLSIFNLRQLTSQSVTITSQGEGSPNSIKYTPSSNPGRPTVPALEGTDVPLPEIINLHNDLGCLMADAQGNYRYMGAESGVGFNTAVRSWVFNAVHDKSKDKIPSMIKVVMPKASSRSQPGHQTWEPSKLPSKDIVLACSARYFEEVHSMYWLFSSEDFYLRLENTYWDPEGPCSNSWLCSLHSLVALCISGMPASDDLSHAQLAHTSLDSAKLYASRVTDEADIDSIRALLLLALALQSNGYLNAAYLQIGTAARIAFSLGLHLDKYSSSDSLVSKAYGRRLWWTLFLFDHDISLQMGKPSMSGSSDDCYWRPPLPSEQIVSPGSYTPHDYLGCCVSLAQLTTEIRHKLYNGPIQQGRGLNRCHVDDSLQSLNKWLKDLPPHLDRAQPASPRYRRCIALLHLRYWSTVILVTRPFLLCRLLRGSELVGTGKQEYFDELAKTCVSAATTSIQIFDEMVNEASVSSLLLFDFFLALAVLQVILVASTLFPSEDHQDNVRRCISILKAIGAHGCPKHLLPETLFELERLGLYHESDDQSHDPNTGPIQNLSSIPEPTSEDWNLLTNFDFFDVTTDDDFMDQLMGMSGSFSHEV
ncbi:hypothetical protein CDV36_010537 [Fusarium kuroshium]|uniref:Zn(2)-C6 fungal-type domain-containing protein n=1 Tax=Fusarium kuroshium TaxID=2010991 RepID=A0A3M2RX04_9HYPO|nr:hypothetical protein CDV36_010537 [Fusarium kuroshium]